MLPHPLKSPSPLISGFASWGKGIFFQKGLTPLLPHFYQAVPRGEGGIVFEGASPPIPPLSATGANAPGAPLVLAITPPLKGVQGETP